MTSNLKDKPKCETTSCGSKYWRLNGKLHRTDGPAIEEIGGTKQWFLNGKIHREDGPAIKYASGTKYWYLNGKFYCHSDQLEHKFCQGLLEYLKELQRIQNEK